MDLNKLFPGLLGSNSLSNMFSGYRDDLSQPPMQRPEIYSASGPSGIRSVLGDLAEGAVMGDFNENPSASMVIGQIGAGFIPVYGQIADARDTGAAIKKVWNGEKGGWRDLGLSVIGWLPGLGDGVKGISRAWRKGGDEATGGAVMLNRTSEGMFYKPAFDYDPALPAGQGWTDKYGNVFISGEGTNIDRALAYHHEMVHSFLSPKFEFLREFRADLGEYAYKNSQLLRYTEEALAETCAQLRVNGLKGLPEGFGFPIKNGYVTVTGVAKEVGEVALGTVAVGGALYRVGFTQSREK